MDLGIIVPALGILAAVLLWIFKPEPVRRLLGLESPPEPEPHPLTGIQMQNFRDDPVIGATVREAESRRAVFAVAMRAQVPTKLSQGFDYFRTPSGAKCHYIGAQGREEFWLLIKEGAA